MKVKARVWKTQDPDTRNGDIQVVPPKMLIPYTPLNAQNLEGEYSSLLRGCTPSVWEDTAESASPPLPTARILIRVKLQDTPDADPDEGRNGLPPKQLQELTNMNW